MGAAALQLLAVAHVCTLMLVRSFDGVNTFTATAASFLIILRHTRMLPLRLLPLPLPQLSSVHLPLPPSLRVSIPPTLSCWPLPARSPQGKLPELGYSVRLHCNAPLWPAIQHTHLDTQIQCGHGPKQAWHSNYIGILLWNVCLVQSKGVFHRAGSFPGLRITTSLLLM